MMSLSSINQSPEISCMSSIEKNVCLGKETASLLVEKMHEFLCFCSNCHHKCVPIILVLIQLQNMRKFIKSSTVKLEFSQE
ncbi:hypothetical protein NC651_037313 [Populus alba x Populus x berolinensis]|uniref:Uncharacterized protein n=1 Tax=Populus alba x Populus x berolinensis TaxID=444605 RepID=A0AAD6LGH7_9ROSI|nr:hypothetical protein NC651_037313 [Populus alba x Populus x berolinensis]KAJ6960331.1 hypothetical protein NC653_038383 [Populus alba x Populus x berolinensis]